MNPSSDWLIIRKHQMNPFSDFLIFSISFQIYCQITTWSKLHFKCSRYFPLFHQSIPHVPLILQYKRWGKLYFFFFYVFWALPYIGTTIFNLQGTVYGALLSPAVVAAAVAVAVAAGCLSYLAALLLLYCCCCSAAAAAPSA